MKKILLLILLTLSPPAPACADGDILVIQSLAIKPYNLALQGFKSVCDIKSQKLLSSELSEAALVEKVRKMRPGLILAIGQDALSRQKRSGTCLSFISWC